MCHHVSDNDRLRFRHSRQRNLTHDIAATNPLDVLPSRHIPEHQDRSDRKKRNAPLALHYFTNASPAIVEQVQSPCASASGRLCVEITVSRHKHIDTHTRVSRCWKFIGAAAPANIAASSSYGARHHRKRRPCTLARPAVAVQCLLHTKYVFYAHIYILTAVLLCHTSSYRVGHKGTQRGHNVSRELGVRRTGLEPARCPPHPGPVFEARPRCRL
jgi:hypothetical protein